MNRLPKVFQNNIEKTINNNKKYFYSASSNNEDRYIKTVSIEEELDNILNKKSLPFSETVIISTKEKTYRTNIIYRSSSNIMTIDNDNIPISSIISLQRIGK